MPNTRILGFRGPAAASRALGAVAAAIVASVLAVAGGSIWQLRQQAEQAARLNADSATVAVAAHAHQVFSSARHVLEGLAARLEAADVQDVQAFKQRFADGATHALLRAQADNFQALDVLSVVAADGDLVNFSRGFPAPVMNILGREGVAESPPGADPQALLITAPRVAIVNGRWTFYVVRQLHTADGRLLGIVQAGIRTDYFADFYQRLQVRPQGPGGYPTMLSLLRADGVVLATAPHDDQRLARPLQLQPGAADPLTAVRAVEGFPAQVAATVHARDYLAAWRTQAGLVAGLALLSAGLLSITFALLVRVLRRREHELAADRRLRIQAEQADRAKTEFLSTITHELRTPMNGVLGTAELLLQPQPPERQRALVETLLGSGRRLLAI
ncbi:MAG: histidine kinase dimerization/phospho-acceptor domain-containing protein, partial [Aquincola tertiaricarbonis]